MPKYLIQVAYTGDAWATQVKSPKSAFDRANTVIESLGGKIESLYYAFGEYDLVGIMDMPSNVNAAAVSLAVSAGGATGCQTLHVGDNPEIDIQGARDAGLKTVWINRDDEDWPDELDAPDGVISDLRELDRILSPLR